MVNLYYIVVNYYICGFNSASQRKGHMGKHLAGWQTTQWVKKNKKSTSFRKLISFLFKVPLRCLPSGKVFEPCDSLSAKGRPLHHNFFLFILGSSKGLFTWTGGLRSSGVGFFCFHDLGDTKQKKPTPLDRGPPLHVNRV